MISYVRPSVRPSAGEKALFDCALESDAPCSVTWLRNNRPLDDRFADRIQVVTKGRKHSLQMMNCRVDDSGLYTAMASNEEGSTTCSASLVVQERNFPSVFFSLPSSY